MPDKEGSDDEKKSTKSVVNKKQKQMMGEEGYDIARDMGKVRPSKDKKDATTMPVSKEMRKTQKVNKGPSALELVKKKYGKAVMKVGKKKANEELDLTQVAEAFGGYIIEAKSGRKPKDYLTGRVPLEKNTNTQPKTSDSKNKDDSEDVIRGKKRISLTGNIPKRERGVPPDAQSIADKDAEQAEKEFKAGGDTTKKFPSEIRDPQTGETLTKDTPPTQQEIERKTKEVKDQSRKTRKSKEKVTRETEFISDPRKESEAPQITQGKGDGRKAGRTPEERKTKQVTYQTFVNKPEVTGGQDRATDTRSSVYIPKPEEIEKVKPKPETKRQKNTRTRKKAEKIIQDVRSGKLQTKAFKGDKKPTIDDVKPQGQDRVTQSKSDALGRDGTVTYGKPEPSKLSKVGAALKKSPVTPLIAYDIGKGILGKIRAMPAVRGGRAIQVSAGK